jgi:hypothetical protein
MVLQPQDSTPSPSSLLSHTDKEYTIQRERSHCRILNAWQAYSMIPDDISKENCKIDSAGGKVWAFQVATVLSSDCYCA